MLKTFAAIALLAAALQAAPAIASEPALAAVSAAIAVKRGVMLYTTDGVRIAQVNSVVEGNAKIIVDGRMVTVPAATLSEVNGKLTTSLSKKELRRR